jgi:hypothetical protein
MADDQGSTSLPLVRANDNPHIAYPLMKDQLASEAFDLYSEYEPTGAFTLIAPDSVWDSEPDNINADASIRARPNPSRQARNDKDTQRESDNKDILDKQHAAFKRAHATLKKAIVASIGTDLCSAIAASHTTGFLRNCSALFMIDWLDAKYGTMQSKHVDQVLDTPAVTLKSSSEFPAHSAHFSLTVRRLRAAEKLATTSFVPTDQQLFTLLKQSFAHLPEFKKSMDAFNTSKTGMANQTFEKLSAFLDDQESLSPTKSPVRVLLVVLCPAVASKSSGPAPLPVLPLLLLLRLRPPPRGRKNDVQRRFAPPPLDSTTGSPRVRRSLCSKGISAIPHLPCHTFSTQTSSRTIPMQRSRLSNTSPRPAPSCIATSTDIHDPFVRTPEPAAA